MEKTKYCCNGMKYLIDEEYLYKPIIVTDKRQLDVEGIAIRGPHLTRTGRKRKPPILVTFCPMCGKKIEEEKDE